MIAGRKPSIKELIRYGYYGFFYTKEFGVGDEIPEGRQLSDLDSLDVFKAKHQIKFLDGILSYLEGNNDRG